MNSTFDELGGNSIMAVKLEIDLEKEGIVFDDINIFKNMSIRNIAAKSLTGTDEVKHDIASSGTKNHVKVFNSIFFKNCFYNALFTILQTCGYPIDEFIINDIIKYNLNEKNILIAEYNEIKGCKEILSNLGVQYKGERSIKDIIDYILNALTQDKLILIWVDPYYASIRKDTYQVKHRAHPWVVTRADTINKFLYIYEHSNSDSLNYKEQKVSYEELKACYESYVNIYQEDLNGFNCYIFTNEFVVSKLNTEIALKYKEYINLNTETFINNFKHQILFINHLSTKILDKGYCLKNEKEIIQTLNDIINTKKIEQYKLVNILPTEKTSQILINEIVNKWELVRSIILRFYFTQIFNEKKQFVIIEELKNICKLEEDYMVALIS